MTTKVLIVNTLSGHWSLVIFAITLNLLHLPRVYGVTHSNLKKLQATLAHCLQYI
mgnify:CR=1 FL=1